MGGARWTVGPVACVLAAGCGGVLGADGATGGGSSATGGRDAAGGAESAGGSPAAGAGGSAACEPPAVVTPGQVDALIAAACVGYAAEYEPLRVVREIAMAVDASMSRTVASSGETRWTVSRAALLGAVREAPDEVWLGAVLGPNLGPTGAVAAVGPQPTEACLEPTSRLAANLLAPAAGQRAAFEALLARVEPSPGRPLEDLYAAAVADARRITGEALVVLVTDGEPTLGGGCTNPRAQLSPVGMAPLIDAITSAAADGIRTRVVGLPGSDALRTALSMAAVAGGTAPPGCDPVVPPYCHDDLSQESDLRAAFAATLDSILTPTVTLPCDFSLPSPPEGVSLLSLPDVIVRWPDGTQEQLAFDASGACGDGFTLDGSTVRLGAAICQAMGDTYPGATPLLMFRCEAGLEP